MTSLARAEFSGVVVVLVRVRVVVRASAENGPRREARADACRAGEVPEHFQIQKRLLEQV